MFWSRHSSGKQIKVAIVVDEFFGGAGTAFGGFGFVARHIICRYLPSETLRFEVLLRRQKAIWRFFPARQIIDGISVIRPPSRWWLPLWLRFKDYDVYLTIELTHDVPAYDPRPWKRIVHWVRDPRPWYGWRRIQAMKWRPEPCYFNPRLNNIVTEAQRRGQVRFISQGTTLNDYARDLYALADDVPIEYLPNPVQTDASFDPNRYPKEDLIIFLGRLEPAKRVWLFCEVARKLPHYQFVVIGKPHRDVKLNKLTLDPYIDGKVKNLMFVGHLEGDEKQDYLKRAKILLNTSVWEAIPNSFLEALAVGTLLVSNVNPENLTARFGAYVGDVDGDGFDKVDLFVSAVASILQDEDRRRALSQEAATYVRTHHSVATFRERMSALLLDEAAAAARKKRDAVAWRTIWPKRP